MRAEVGAEAWLPRALAGLRHAAAADQVMALTAAAAVATDAELQVLAGELIGLIGHREAGVRAGALRALITEWMRLSPVVREEAARVLGQHRAAVVARVAQIAAEGDAPGRMSAARAVSDLGLGGAAGVLEAMMLGTDALLIEECAKTFEKLAGDARSHCAELDAAVCAAAREFTAHRRREVLAAMGELMGTCAGYARMRGLAADMLSGEGGGGMALRGMVKRDSEGAKSGARARAWLWATSSVLAPACVERLVREDGAPEHERSLALAHLALNPLRLRVVADRLAKILPAGVARGQSGARGDSSPAAAPLLARGDEVRELSESARAGLAGLAEKLGNALGDTAAAEEVVAALASDESARVRHAALRAVRTTTEDGAGYVVLGSLCGDPEESVARGAALSLLSRARRVRMGAERTAEVVRALQRSDHGSVRAVAACCAGAGDAFDARNAAGRMMARRRLHAGEDGRGQLLERVRERLLTGDDAAALDAVAVARGLGVVTKVEEELCELVRESAAALVGGRTGRVRAASAAVTALGGSVAGATAEPGSTGDGSVSARGTSMLRWCVMQHPDARCRANALEALVRRERRAGRWGAAEDGGREGAGVRSMVIECTADAHHRVRGSAVRAALEAMRDAERSNDVETVRAVGPMLMDERPMHRAAGLWLMKRCALGIEARPWMELSGLVAEMVRSDPEEEVRVRARACAAVLLLRMRSGRAHQSGAAAVGVPEGASP